MAASTKAEQELKEEPAQEPAAQAAPAEGTKPEAAPEAQKDPWSEEVEMYVPRRRKGEEQSYYICINDRRFSLPANGKMQKMPLPVAEVLKMCIQAEAEADEYADSIDRIEDQPMMTV